MSAKDEITNMEDYLDSRDIQERIEYLKQEMQEDAKNKLPVLAEYEDELERLNNLKEQYINDYNESSWGYGAQFIRVSYFEEYAQQLAEDCGYIQSDRAYQWPYNNIDWKAAADELATDYSGVSFNGVEYYTQEA